MDRNLREQSVVKSGRLGWAVRIGFGSGDFAQNLVYPAVCMYLLFFYTDIFGLAPAKAATMFLVAQAIDMVWNPLVGTFIDRHNPPWGKYRSYLLLAGIPLSLIAVLCFFDPLPGPCGVVKTVYAYATYTALSMLFTTVNVAYGALNSSLTRDTDEITVLTTVRIFMANAGCFAASAGVPLLVALLAGKTELPWRMALFMGLGILPSFIFLPLLPTLRRRLGKKGLFYVFAPVAVAGMAMLYALSAAGAVESRPGLVYAAQFVKATGIVVSTGYMWALVPEVIAFSEHRTGRRVSAMVNSIMGIFFRLGMAIGKILPGLVLAWTGYRAAEQEASTLPATPGAWLLAFAVIAAVAIASLVFSFTQTRERVVMNARETSRVCLSDLWREFRDNPPLRVLALFFVVAFAMMSVGNAAGAYFMNGLDSQSPLAQEGVRWLVCVIPAFLIAAATAVMARYPLTDEAVDAMNREIEARC